MAITVPTQGTEITVVGFGKPVADEVNRLTTVTTPPAWIAPTLLNGWINFGSIYQPARYRKIGDMVYIEGLVKGGGPIDGVAPIFTLPVGYRPVLGHQFAVPSNAVYALMVVQSGGNIVPYVGSSASSFQINCSFSIS